MEELFVVAENGQVEVNWESLALVTSEEFVKKIKFWVDRGEIVDSIVELPDFVTVIISDLKHGQIAIFDFYKKDGKISIRRLTDSELKALVSIYGGRINGL